METARVIVTGAFCLLAGGGVVVGLIGAIGGSLLCLTIAKICLLLAMACGIVAGVHLREDGR